ncbi:MAG: galactose mutarotase [Mesorhizobium sp.]|nr:aldose epimerase family protein [Mesorhizobium sp.]MBL8579573.1 galactose mutarotase [Mesorhizobium sp.]
MADGEIFGTTADGKPVHRFGITGGGLTAHVMTWGASVQDLRLAGHDAPLVLGFDTFEPYPQYSSYMGAIAGRYANRIANGQFTIDGKTYQADKNFLGKHTLHGGSHSYGKQVWDVASHGVDFVTLSLRDPDGAMGFPGNLDVVCTYRVKAGGVLSVELTATTDKPTLCNLAHHSYFNLDDGGSGDILGHSMVIPAGAYLPVDDELIPTGVVQPVDDTAFDFRKPRAVDLEEEGEQVLYDHNFCLHSDKGPLRQATWVKGATSGVEMEVWSTEPGVQFYAGAKIERPVPGHEGRMYKAYAGLALEPQVWPDSPNRAYFPQALLRPDEVYRQVTEYRFSMAT